MFSCEFWQISKKTFFDRTPPMIASGFERAQCYWDYGGICLTSLNKQITANTSNWQMSDAYCDINC